MKSRRPTGLPAKLDSPPARAYLPEPFSAVNTDSRDSILVSDVVRTSRRQHYPSTKKIGGHGASSQTTAGSTTIFSEKIQSLVKQLKESSTSVPGHAPLRGGSRFDQQLGRDSQCLVSGPLHENRFLYDARRDFDKVSVVKHSF